MSEERKAKKVATRVLLSRSIRLQAERLERLERKRQKATDDLRRLEYEVWSAQRHMEETQQSLSRTNPDHMTVIEHFRPDSKPEPILAAS